MLTHAEQYMLELLNRTRLDPLGEVERNPKVADLNQGMDELRAEYIRLGLTPPDYLTPEVRQPLAPNPLLKVAAHDHGQWMLDTNIFSHTGADDSLPRDRILATGYAEGSFLRASGENLAWDGLFPGPVDPDVSAGQHHDDLFESPSHRVGLLAGFFREAGIAQEVGTFTHPDDNGIVRDWSASIAVHKFASRGDDLFLTGVAFDDADGDGFYSMGEGLAGVGFTVAGVAATTAAAGGYALPVAPAQQGPATAVTVTWGEAQKQLAVGFSDGNVKLDLMQHDGGLRLLSSADTTLGAGASEAALLGAADLRLTGNDDGNLLIGNRGANLILGGAGDDTLQGGGGDDTLQGGGGWNIARFDGARDAFTITAAGGVLTVTDTSDGSPEGTNTLHDIHALHFGDGSEWVVGAAPVAIDDTAEATEAGAAVTGNVLANDDGIALGVIALDGAAPGTPVAGSYGTLTLWADGSFTYQPGSALPLPAGVTGTDSFTYTVANLADARDTATLSITVTGVNDPASISGTATGAVTERDPDAATAAGVLTVTDPDAGEDRFQPVAAEALQGSFGAFAFDPDSGAWSYTLDDSAPALRALDAGQTGTDTLTVTSLDGTASETVTVTVTGTELRLEMPMTGHAATRHGADIAEATVTFTPAHGEPLTALTDADGRFDLAIPHGTPGHLALHRDFTTGDAGPSIASAINAIRLALGLGLASGDTVTPHDWIAADFTGDGRVNLADGIEILRSALGLATDHAARWVFVDAAADLTAIDRSHVVYDTGIPIGADGPPEDLSLIGILIGQV